jgi:hypothetical protein
MTTTIRSPISYHKVSLRIIVIHHLHVQFHFYSKTKSSTRIRNNNSATKGKERQQKTNEIHQDSVYTG